MYSYTICTLSYSGNPVSTVWILLRKQSRKHANLSKDIKSVVTEGCVSASLNNFLSDKFSAEEGINKQGRVHLS